MVFLVNMARVVFAPLVQPAAADFGVTPAALGVVASAAWLGSAAPRLPTGYLLTKTSRAKVVAGTGALLVVTSLVTAAAGSVAHLAVGAFAMGTSSGIYFIAALPLVSELYPDRVGSAIGVHGLSSQLASISAPLLLSAVLVAGDWRTTFVLIAVLAAVITTGLVWASRRTTLPDAGREDRSLRAAIRSQWRLVATGVAVIGVAGFLWNGLFNLYGDYLTVAKGIDPATGRLLLSVMFAAGAVAVFGAGRLADRLPNVPMLLALSSGFGVSVFALTVVSGVALIAAVSVCAGTFFFALLPTTDTYLLSSLPDHHRASAYSVYSAAMMFVQALGSGSVGLVVVGGTSYDTTFQGLAAVVLLVVVVLTVLHRLDRLPTGGRPAEPA
jgi:predicted MFS family arabinose efflux permease